MEFSTPVSRAAVGLAEGEQPAPGGGATLTFGTADIHVVKTALDAARVRQDGNVQEIPGMVRLLTFYDSDWNALVFYEDLQSAVAR